MTSFLENTVFEFCVSDVIVELPVLDFFIDLPSSPKTLFFVIQAEENQKTCREKFDALSETGKGELTEFKSRRVTAFRKNLIELGELQLKHSKVRMINFKSCEKKICLFVHRPKPDQK